MDVKLMADAVKGSKTKVKVAGVKVPRPQNAFCFILAGAELIGTRAALKLDVGFLLDYNKQYADVAELVDALASLLQLMGTLDTPSAGAILFQGRDISALGWQERAAIRNKNIGFVFQFHHLLPEFSAREDAAMSGIIGGIKYVADEFSLRFLP